MNFTEKPDHILQIYLLVLRIGLAITIIYAVRQVVLVLLLLLCNCRSRRIELAEIEDYSLREEQGRLETNYLNFTTVDHLFKFDQHDQPKRSNRVRKRSLRRRRIYENSAAKRSVKVRGKNKRNKERATKDVESASSAPSVPEISQREFQHSMIDEIDEYSIESSPVNESSLLALSDSERNIEFKIINEKKIGGPLQH